jgi:LuxR family transcriptional regulator, maltose regulon positive regulatory protein
MIARPDLVARVSSATAFVTLVSAAGFGKSTLLREWDVADERRFVWTAGGAGPLAEQIADGLGCSGPTTDEPRASRIRSAVEHPDSPFVLVVDDVHRASGPDLAILAALADLSLGPGVVVALAGRSIDPRLAARLRLRGGLVELDESRLAFDADAAAAVVASRSDRSSVESFVERTDGWPVAVRLATVACDEGGTSLDAFSGRDRLMREYLDAEVLSGLDPVDVDLLRRCAAFDVVRSGMGEDVLGVPDAQRRLEAFEDAHLLVRAIDRERTEFRLHPMLRDALAADLARIDPTRLETIRKAGAGWLAHRGHTRESLALHLQNGDRTVALGMLADVVMPMFAAGQLRELVDLIHGIGPDVAVDSGYLATMFAYAGMMTGDVVCTQRWGRAAQRFYTGHRFGSSDEEAAYFTFRAHLAPDGVKIMREDAEHARSIVGETSVWRSPTLMLCGIAAALCGDAVSATASLDEADHISVEDVNRPALLLTLGARVLIAESQGDHGRAKVALQSALDVIDRWMATYPQAALPLALAALSAARLGERSRAAALLASAGALRPVVGAAIPWLGVQVRLTLARAAVTLGEVDSARALLAEAEELIVPVSDARQLADDAAELTRRVQTLPMGGASAGAGLLTTAELRVLPHLASHLTFEEIGGRLHLSKNTVKTQAISVYRKLGASSRSEAVDIARDLALIDA